VLLGIWAQGREAMSISLDAAQEVWERAMRSSCAGLPQIEAQLHNEEQTRRVRTLRGSYDLKLMDWGIDPMARQWRLPGGRPPPLRGPSPPSSTWGSAVEGSSAWGEARWPTVLFLHGFLGGPQDWTAVASALSLSCHCIAVELPGHSQTPCNALKPSAHPQ